MIIDAHNHLEFNFKIDNTDYIDQLKQCKIDKIMLCAIGNERWGTNSIVKGFMSKYPDIVIGFAYLNIDEDNLSIISEYKEQGFVGLKIIGSQHAYDNDDYMLYYETAASLGMPILFHCGFLGVGYYDKINCNNYRPMMLDTIARRIPQLKIICAHMGSPWWDEALLIMSRHQNIYCDMSGLSVWQRDMDFWLKMFKPNGKLHDAIYKLIFGSDNFTFGSSKYSPNWLKLYERFFGLLGLDDKVKELILFQNFLKLC